MRVSAISPSINGSQRVNRENARQINPNFSVKSPYNSDSVSFKGAELLLRDCATKKELFPIIYDRLPAYFSNHHSKCLDMYYSLTAAMDSFQGVAKQLPDNMRFVFGFKKFNVFGKFYIYYTSGYKRNSLTVENVEDLLDTVSRNKDFFKENNRFEQAKNFLTDALKPEMKDKLNRGERILVNNVLEDGDGRTMVVHRFSPYGRYLPEEMWMREFAKSNRDRDIELLAVYHRALDLHGLIEPYREVVIPQLPITP